MKKSLLFASVFAVSAMADSYCLTGSELSNERVSTECVSSNNLCTVGVLRADCGLALAACDQCALYKANGTTMYKKVSDCGKNTDGGIAWANVERPAQFADASLERCACTDTECTNSCKSVV